jgi:lipooligosaccharide transport system ATP-binding protein
MKEQKIIVEAHALTKRFKDKTVVRGIDFRVPAGQCFGFLGPNGAGKTTTLRLILGQSPIDAGTLQVFGLPVPRHGSEVRRRVGVVPQSDNLDPDFTVVENLRVYGAYFRLPRAALERRIEELLVFVGLADRADTKIPTLSGGMKRRLTIARALINDPEMVVLDEPTTGLDPQVRHMIWARLRDLRHAGKTLLLTTHYMEEAERLCDDLVIMDRGVILDQGSPRKLVRAHVEPEVVEMRAGTGRVEELLKGVPDCRTELVGDTVYCYAHDAHTVLERVDGAADLIFLHRPANLEDVFLKLTGRELKE